MAVPGPRVHFPPAPTGLGRDERYGRFPASDEHAYAAAAVVPVSPGVGPRLVVAAPPARVAAPAADSERAPLLAHDSLTEVTNAVRKHVGDIRKVLRAENDKNLTPETYAAARAARGDPPPAGSAPGSPDYERWLNAELEEKIQRAARALLEEGIHSTKQVDDLAAKAWHADLGTTFLKGITGNAIAYGTVSAGILAITLPLTLALGPIGAIPLAVAALGMALYATYKFSVHSLTASADVNREFDARKGRRRFYKVGDAKTLGKAVGTALLADGARTGLRCLVQLPLRIASGVLGFLKTATPAATAMGLVVGPIATLMGPPTNGLMQVCHQALLGRKGKTLAPAFGIDVNKDSKSLEFKEGVAKRTIQRLDKPMRQRIRHSICRLGSAYDQHYGTSLRKEKKLGMTFDKWAELLFGGNTLGPSMSAVGAVAGGVGVASAAVSAGLKIGFPALGSLLGATNFLTQAPVHRKSKFIQKTKQAYKTRFGRAAPPPNPGEVSAAGTHRRCRAPWE